MRFLTLAAMAGAERTRRFDRDEKIRVGAFSGAIAAIHLVGWGLLLTQSTRYPALLGLGAVAYSFGLRHAFDADHLAAIDDTTRKLLQQGKKPLGTGFFFSLGHSTVVLAIVLALGVAARAVMNNVVNDGGLLRSAGGLIGTSVSGAFLLLMGLINLVVLLDIASVYRRMRRGELDGPGLEQSLAQGGALVRAFRGLFRFVNQSWQMYPIGFLFGLGFDTASEIALLAISAGAASQGLPLFGVLSLPLIFAAGMCLMDTADGVFMVKAYSWAFSNPIRKVFYNLTMTGLSVFIALFVGGVEIVQLIARAANLEGGFWRAVASVDLATLGYVIVGCFVVAWALAFGAFKLRRVEEAWAAAES